MYVYSTALLVSPPAERPTGLTITPDRYVANQLHVVRDSGSAEHSGAAGVRTNHH